MRQKNPAKQADQASTNNPVIGLCQLSDRPGNTHIYETSIFQKKALTSMKAEPQAFLEKIQG